MKPLPDFSVPDFDSFDSFEAYFRGEEAGPPEGARDERAFGLTKAFDVAPDAAFDGISQAVAAPGRPVDLNPEPQYERADEHRFGDDSDAVAITWLEEWSLDAKGGGGNGGGKGGPGGGSNGGGSDGGGSDGGSGGFLTEYFAGSDDGDAGYDIWIEFKGSDWTSDLQQAFIDAADYLTTVITDDIGGGGRVRGDTIDDLYVSATLTGIDGAGGVLGQAGPSGIWNGVDLTALGVMEFDTADAETFAGLGLWDDIVAHEMMHVLGFGTLWEYGSHDLLDASGNYVGAAGLAAYQATVDPTATFIEVEQDGGPGTAGGHWDEAVYGNELMTGFIDNPNYFSEFSVMSLADLGYVVAYQDYPYDGFA